MFEAGQVPWTLSGVFLEARSSNGLGARWTSLLGVALLLGCWTGLESAHAVPLVQLYHVVSAEVLWCAKTHPGRGYSGLCKKGWPREGSAGTELPVPNVLHPHS